MTLAAPLDSDAEQRIMAALATVPDPEIPVVSVMELGIVRSVQCDPPAVLITPTYTGCPATLVIEQSVRAALNDAGFAHVPIKTVLSPPWTTDWISEDGRNKLKAYGIAPPPRGSAARSLRGPELVECPRCASNQTLEISRFGSTPCKALWQCQDCKEPFDRFKCH
ncbi:phenylacetate-CoA oxygenase subunit PaaJ [Sphingobium sp. SCG-1]|uniref:1,2-phenylacetyl-CoA epoxidase subunit PaaD n=1 Tax=Sphingobium sp. SCG-1 TaxID=2072936 RepID=UPI000CD6A989|nr:1,2-phenylacetyl-CoA epoxidase subunit PaaD [Sphingobium sp. SCG-1]AUW58778.1 phenylacetate-CoA oxygenase subunit PaaJ [Sphingobium sp. SCG-1]